MNPVTSVFEQILKVLRVKAPDLLHKSLKDHDYEKEIANYLGINYKQNVSGNQHRLTFAESANIINVEVIKSKKTTFKLDHFKWNKIFSDDFELCRREQDLCAHVSRG